MRTLIFCAPDRMEIQELAPPVPATGEALIKVHFAGICGSEVNAFRGHSARHKPPLIMGHELAGSVAALAPDVEDLTIGQLVTINPLLSCGECEACVSGRVNICANRRLIGVDLPGGFAEYVAVPRSSVYPLPPGMTPAIGVMVEPLANTVHLVQQNVKGLINGVAILGAGTQGLLALQMTGLLGVTPRIIMDVEAYRLEMAKRFGADLTINALHEDPVRIVSDFTGGRGVDLVIEAVGSSVTRQQSIALAPRGGRIVFLGMHESKSELDCWAIVAGELSVHGAVMYSCNDFHTAIQLLATQRITAYPYLTEFPLADGQRVFQTLSSQPGTLVKAILTP